MKRSPLWSPPGLGALGATDYPPVTSAGPEQGNLSDRVFTYASDLYRTNWNAISDAIPSSERQSMREQTWRAAVDLALAAFPDDAGNVATMTRRECVAAARAAAEAGKTFAQFQQDTPACAATISETGYGKLLKSVQYAGMRRPGGVPGSADEAPEDVTDDELLVSTGWLPAIAGAVVGGTVGFFAGFGPLGAGVGGVIGWFAGPKVAERLSS